MIDMQMQDTTVICGKCGQAFTFSAAEQQAFARRGQSKPTSCAFCRAAEMIAHPGADRAGDDGSAHSAHGERQMYTAFCSDCGKKTAVPFEPSGRRPVYCSNCYQNHAPAGGGRYRPGSYNRR